MKEKDAAVILGRAGEVVEAAVEAVGRRIPMKVDSGFCPRCKGYVSQKKISDGYGCSYLCNAKFCPECGQALDWSEE